MKRRPVVLVLGGSAAEGQALIANFPVEWTAAAVPDTPVWNAALLQIDPGLWMPFNTRSTTTGGFVLGGPEVPLFTALRNLNGGEGVTMLKLAIVGSSINPHAGGSGIPVFDWATPGEVRAELTNRLLSLSIYAAGQGELLDIRGVYWHQGETDTFISAYADAYAWRLENLIEHVRALVVANGWTTLTEPVPWVTVVIHDFTQLADMLGETFYIDRVREAQRAVARDGENVYTVEAEGKSLKADILNHDAGGITAIAYEAAVELAPFLPNAYLYSPGFVAPELVPLPDPPDLEPVVERYGRMGLQLLPQGLAWTRERDSTLARVIEALLVEHAKVDARANDLIRESTPRNATELLADYERILGIPRFPLAQPGHYANLRTVDGSDDLRLICSPTFPVPAVAATEFTLTTWLRPLFESNGWTRPDGTQTLGRHYVFRRLSSATDKGIRVYLETTSTTLELGDGNLAPALELHVELGNGTTITDYLVATDEQLSKPLLDALAAPVAGSTDVVGAWGFLAIVYEGHDGPAGADRGVIRAFAGGTGPLVQVGSDVNVQPTLRMEHAAGTEGVIIGSNGSFDPLVGDVDQTRVYDRGLEALELQGIHNLGAGRRLIGTETDLVLGWEIDVAEAGAPETTKDVVNPGTASDLELGADVFITSGSEFGVVLAERRCGVETAPTLLLRRFEAVTRLALQAIGGQSPAFFVDVAAQLGFAVEIEENEPITCESHCEAFLTSEEWVFVWSVRAPSLTPQFARVGAAQIGDRLVDVDVSRLECVVDDLKPAHTRVIFRYDLDPITDYAPWSSAEPDALDVGLELPPVTAG